MTVKELKNCARAFGDWTEAEYGQMNKAFGNPYLLYPIRRGLLSQAGGSTGVEVHLYNQGYRRDGVQLEDGAHAESRRR